MDCMLAVKPSESFKYYNWNNIVTSVSKKYRVNDDTF